MKKIFLCAFAFLMFSVVTCEAKYVKKESSGTPATRLAKSDMTHCDADKDGFLTLDEYKTRKTRKKSRTDRRNVRLAKKEGSYKTSTQMFNEMDADEDGKINIKDLEKYYTARRAKGYPLY